MSNKRFPDLFPFLPWVSEGHWISPTESLLLGYISMFDDNKNEGALCVWHDVIYEDPGLEEILSSKEPKDLCIHLWSTFLESRWKEVFRSLEAAVKPLTKTSRHMAVAKWRRLSRIPCPVLKTTCVQDLGLRESKVKIKWSSCSVFPEVPLAGILPSTFFPLPKSGECEGQVYLGH
jgi:hypothetical protein